MKQLIVCSSLALTLLSAMAGPGAHGPNGEHLDKATTGNANGLMRWPDGSVNVPKLAQRRMGIRTQLAPEAEASATQTLPGRVVQDPNASGRVQATHGGRIEPGPRGLPVAGQMVKKGEVLAWLRHHADPYALAQQEALRSELRAARELAESKVKRLEGLEGTVPRKDIEAARIEAVSLRARERSIASSIESREALVAPVSGVIARTELLAGQVIEARDVLVEIVDPQRLMIEAQTTDVGLASRIANAQSSTGQALRLVGAPRALRDGVLPLSFKTVGSDQGAPLALGQTVQVIVSFNDKVKGIILPADSVVRSSVNEQVVWIKTGAERYMPQPVRALPLDTRRVLVIQGLAADNRVVVEGAPLIAQIR